jgi:hypothetical protein
MKHLLVVIFGSILVFSCKQRSEDQSHFASCVVDYYTNEPVRLVELKVFQGFADKLNSSNVIFTNGKDTYTTTDHNGCFYLKKQKGGIVVASPYDFFRVDAAPAFPEARFINKCNNSVYPNLLRPMDCNLVYMATPRIMTLTLKGLLLKYPNYYIQIANQSTGSFSFGSSQKVLEERRVGNDLILKISCLPDLEKQVKFAIGIPDLGHQEEHVLNIETEKAKTFNREVLL